MVPLTDSAAHHSFAAQYDAATAVKIEGVVVKIEWMNPHAYFFVDVEDPATGKVQTWSAEMGAPAVLVRRGWTRNSLKVGDLVTVDGAAARDGSASLNAQSVVLTDTGERLFTRSEGEQREADRVRTESPKSN